MSSTLSTVSTSVTALTSFDYIYIDHDTSGGHTGSGPYVDAKMAGSDLALVMAAQAPVQSVAGRAGTVTLAVADVSGAAPKASPAFTGAVGLSDSSSGNVTLNITNTNASGGANLAASALQFTNDASKIAAFFWTNSHYNNGVGTLANTFGTYSEGPVQFVVYDGTNLHVALNATVQGAVKVGETYTIANLPTSQPAGSRAQVSDNTLAMSAATWGTAPVNGGGGSHMVPVFTPDGTNWLIG